MQPDLIPFREYARVHVAAAKTLLAGDGAQLRYACLEIRLAIEALAYAVLQNYSEDDSSDVEAAQADWQPSKVLEALLNYDPMVEMSVRIVMRAVVPGGDPGDIVMDAVDQRFSAEWAAKAHRSMGSFLHQRTIREVRRGKQLDEAVLRREAERVLRTLCTIMESPLSDTRIGFRLRYDCPECASELSVALMPLMLTGATRHAVLRAAFIGGRKASRAPPPPGLQSWTKPDRPRRRRMFLVAVWPPGPFPKRQLASVSRGQARCPMTALPKPRGRPFLTHFGRWHCRLPGSETERRHRVRSEPDVAG